MHRGSAQVAVLVHQAPALRACQIHMLLQWVTLVRCCPLSFSSLFDRHLCSSFHTSSVIVLLFFPVLSSWMSHSFFPLFVPDVFFKCVIWNCVHHFHFHSFGIFFQSKNNNQKWNTHTVMCLNSLPCSCAELLSYSRSLCRFLLVCFAESVRRK